MRKKLSFKIWLLIITLVLSFLSIFVTPNFMQKGVLVTSVDSNSTVFEQGLRQGQAITSIDNQPVENINDFAEIIKAKYDYNHTVKTIIETNKGQYVYLSNSPPEITVSKLPKTNIKLGLDLVGGARALIKAENKTLSTAEVNDLVDITSNRLNEFGLTDLNVKPVSDLQGNHFMLIEIAGATPKDLEDLIAKQGKFEAKIGNQTAFIGGQRDIASVCRNDASCAGVTDCQQSGGQYFCNFRFSVYLSDEAAKRHAEITKNISVNTTAQGNYLSKKLDLYVDDKLLDSLLISEGLRGRVTTQISIQGSGKGETRDAAYEDAKNSMHKLQTILITGSLPYKLDIVKLDTISPALGKEFIRSIFIAAIVALLMVLIVIFIRYRKIKLSLALILTSLSEIIIILGIAAFIEWNLDLPSIAGILATIGTGVDDQVVILDESQQSKFLTLKQRLKRAFAIIMGSYATSLVSLLPLIWAGAGLLKGFAVTTIIGISVGVFITRPAFSDVVKRMED